MFGYDDYYDEQLKNTGYVSSSEYLKDHLKLIDMLLEHYLDKKTARSEGLIFSRGMKMTEEEIEGYYFTEPKKRVSIGFSETLAEDVARAAEYIAQREKNTGADVFLPISECVRAFGLSEEEKLALVIAVSVHADMKYTRLYGYIAGEASLQYPTAGVFKALLETYDKTADNSAERLVSEASSFRRFCLDEEVIGEKKRPLLHTPLVLNGTLTDHIFSEGKSDDRGKEKSADSKTKDFYADQTDFIRTAEAFKSDGQRFFYIECEDAGDVRTMLSLVDDKKLYSLDVTKGYVKLREDVIRAALDDARIALYMPEKADIQELTAKLKHVPVIWLYGEAEMPDELFHGTNGITAVPMKLPLPDVLARYDIWKSLMEEYDISFAEDVDIEELSDTYSFSYTVISDIVRQLSLYCDSRSDRTVDRELLLDMLFRCNKANFAGLATRVHAFYTWDDIEMAPSQKKRLMTAVNRYRLKGRIDEKYGVAKRNAYGNGVSVLLYGAPGTGKTMAAQIVSTELGLPLYRVDVSQIFSKYIGETQKNLGKIFEEAKKANVILFFDEADALFAKRTDVGDSNDRYANSETAYLLQKVEEYSGLVILATNLYHNFDSAFVRRITYVVHVDSPNEATREKLWMHILPEEVPMAPDIDYEFLAERFELSGSNIKAVLQSAAYMAGTCDRPVSMADIITALRYELEKMGRIVDSTEYGRYGVYLNED